MSETKIKKDNRPVLIVFGILILTLIFKPSGILGKKIIEKV